MIRKIYDNDPKNLKNYDKQDAIILNLQRMKGILKFRNIAIHEYQELDMEIVKDVIENNLKDLEDFSCEILRQCKKG